MMSPSLRIRRQQGASLIMFLLMIPVLLGFMVLSIEGGRYLRTKSAVADATEAASLAISARASLSDTTNQTLAENYINALLPDAKDISVTVSRKECSEMIGECTPDWGKNSSFIQYNTSTSATFDSWFPKSNGNVLAFDKEITVSNKASVRKFQGDGALDVVFAADFSGGMRCELGKKGYCSDNPTNPNSKVELLKKVLERVALKVEELTEGQSEKNTMAFVPFSSHTHEPRRNHNNRIYCSVMQSLPPETGSYAEAKDTFDNMFETKGCDGNANNPTYYTIQSTEQADDLIDKINEFKAIGATAIYTGIIRAGKIALKGKNQRRLIIVMTDGIDNGPDDDNMNMIDYKINFEDHHEELNNLGYCQRIRQEINNQPSSDPNRPVMSRIVAIGFDYNVDENRNLQDCIGESEIYSARGFDHMYDIIIGLLAEEVGHLYRS